MRSRYVTVTVLADPMMLYLSRSRHVPWITLLSINNLGPGNWAATLSGSRSPSAVVARLADGDDPDADVRPEGAVATGADVDLLGPAGTGEFVECLGGAGGVGH
jgi:hypothetical protein